MRWSGDGDARSRAFESGERGLVGERGSGPCADRVRGWCGLGGMRSCLWRVCGPRGRASAVIGWLVGWLFGMSDGDNIFNAGACFPMSVAPLPCCCGKGKGAGAVSAGLGASVWVSGRGAGRFTYSDLVSRT